MPSVMYVLLCSPPCACAFRVQRRFRLLRLPLGYFDVGGGGIRKVECAFKTCCILHNWIMEVDGLDQIGSMPEHWHEVSPDELRARRRIYALVDGKIRRCGNRAWLVHDGTDVSRCGSQSVHPDYDNARGELCPTVYEPSFFTRRQQMIDHYDIVSSATFDTAGGTFDVDVPKWQKTAAELRDEGVLPARV